MELLGHVIAVTEARGLEAQRHLLRHECACRIRDHVRKQPASRDGSGAFVSTSAVQCDPTVFVAPQHDVSRA